MKLLDLFGFILYNILFSLHIPAHLSQLPLNLQYFNCQMVIRRQPYIWEELQCQFYVRWYLCLCKKCSPIETDIKLIDVLKQLRGLCWQLKLLFPSRKTGGEN